MKYEVGQKVKIKSLDWYNENKDEYGYVRCTDFRFTPEHSKYCGHEFTISHITEFPTPSYVMENNGHDWSDEMIEGLVEEEMSLDKAGQITDFEYEGLAYTLPDGYQFIDEKGNVINAMKIVLEKKKKEYPKSYEECCDILQLEHTFELNDLTIEEETLFKSFIQLKRCRDAYWKIAGEEMGLGKPWEPDWTNNGVTKYCIGVSESDIQNFSSGVAQYTLAFPTEEMRDAFYENFRELIESVKELL